MIVWSAVYHEPELEDLQQQLSRTPVGENNNQNYTCQDIPAIDLAVCREAILCITAGDCSVLRRGRLLTDPDPLHFYSLELVNPGGLTGNRFGRFVYRGPEAHVEICPCAFCSLQKLLRSIDVGRYGLIWD